ncbi:G-protein coupled receptor 37-like 1 [Solea solea]|uniref:G-protein coupled receptor 37-like 1 n=1 Tax=Solea solea TaxID=90069 RepID=UPI002729F7B4|nr:G-protein coupled receptor 37-like 1 [Solea solea]
MSPPVFLWTCVLLPLLCTQANSVAKLNSRGNAIDKPSPPLWSGRVKVQDDTHTSDQSLLTELLDLDGEQRHRLARGTDEDEQQSTFGQSFENDFVTTPQVTALNNATSVAAAGGDGGDVNDDRLHGNTSISNDDVAGFFNPFYPVVESSYVAYAVVVVAGLVLAVGVVGNMVVMCVVWNNYYMRSAWNYLLASMAFWDFLVLVLCLPVVVLNHLTHRRILGDVTCRMVPYMEVVSLGITTFTLCALGIARFHAATSSSQPKARRVERCRSVLLKLLLVWSCALLLSSPEIFLWQHSQAVSPSSGRLIDSCTVTLSSPLTLYLPDSLHSLLLRYHQGRMWWCFGCYFCLPVLFTLLCQMATRNVNSDYSSAKKQQRDHDDCTSNQKRQEHQAVERQRNCTLLALAVVYGVCALPEHVCNITLAYTHIVLSEDMAAMLALLHHLLLFFKAAVTPVLLLCLCKTLGQAFMDCCCCCCQECQPDAAHGSPGSAHIKLKEADETSILFDKAKDTSAILSISS